MYAVEGQGTKTEENRLNTWDEWKQKIEIKNGYAVMMFTDRFEVEVYPFSKQIEKHLMECFEDKLLDLRVFNENAEYRIFRGDAGKAFRFRIQDDTGEEYYDDEQYLDIDEARSLESFQKGKIVRATGGGYYKLPLETFYGAKVRLRNYLAYEEDSGQAYIKDWRLLGFYLETGEEQG